MCVPRLTHIEKTPKVAFVNILICLATARQLLKKNY
jgi:hypothetical protein